LRHWALLGTRAPPRCCLFSRASLFVPMGFPFGEAL
jgi:hypothetical protein